MARGRRRRQTSEATREWLRSEQGQLWLEEKIAEKHARRPDPWPSPFPPHRYPFPATINGRPVVVREDGIEWVET